MKLIITEQQEKELIKMLKESEGKEVQQMPVDKKVNKPYTINPDKVLIVKKFLDNNFKKGSIEKIGSNGLREVIPIVSIMSSTGEPLKNLYKEDLLGMMIEQYKSMFLDKTERELFLKQVMEDWFNNKIGVFGTLSVNHL